MVIFLRSIKSFCYISENESKGDVLGRDKSSGGVDGDGDIGAGGIDVYGVIAGNIVMLQHTGQNW